MGDILTITFIFDRCHHSSAVVTPAKYEHDIPYITNSCGNDEKLDK